MDGTVGFSAARPKAADDSAMGAARIEALFGSILVAACAACVASAMLAGGLGLIGILDPTTGLVWVGYIFALAFCNILLRRTYRRSRPSGEPWRPWALWFAAINCCVGIGFGSAPLGLTAGRGPAAELIVLVVTIAEASAGIPVFSPYLPAFLLYFLAATLPFAAASFFSADPVVHRLAPPERGQEKSTR